jgi:preprotein translocase subunit SecG
MLPTITILIAVVSVLLILVILMQNSKGGGIDPNFGGQAQQLFGAARSTDFIEKATWALAATLIVLCVVAVLTVGGGGAEATDLPLQSAPQ